LDLIIFWKMFFLGYYVRNYPSAVWVHGAWWIVLVVPTLHSIRELL